MSVVLTISSGAFFILELGTLWLTLKDTLESFELIRNEFPDLKTVTLVSDPAHLWRSQLMAQNLGFQTQVSGTNSGPGSELSNSYFVREVASTLRYEFKRHFSSQWSLLRSIVL